MSSSFIRDSSQRQREQRCYSQAMDSAKLRSRLSKSPHHLLLHTVVIAMIIVSLTGCGPFESKGSGQSLINGAGSKPSILTPEQASRLISFKLVIPTQIPTGVKLSGVEVSNGSVSSVSGASQPTGSSLAKLATLLYRATNGGKTGSWPYAIEINESTMTLGSAGVPVSTPSTSAYGTAASVPTGVIGPDNQSAESIDGTQVVKSHFDLGGQITALSYLWKSGDLSFSLNVYDAAYTDSTARGIISSMIGANQ